MDEAAALVGPAVQKETRVEHVCSIVAYVNHNKERSVMADVKD